MPTGKKPSKDLRVVILTALPLEFNEVRRQLKKCKPENYEGSRYERGSYETKTQTWDVLVAETGKNNAAAAAATAKALQFFKPRIALFVGIAGGIKDVSIGDVVAASEVYGYEYGKSKETFLPRSPGYRSSHDLVECAKEIARDQLAKKQKPKYFVQPIAAGEKVITSKRSAIYHFIVTHLSHTVAVEMEGIGFLAAAYENQKVSVLVVRGISDLIKNKKTTDVKGCQERAAKNAAIFAFMVLENIPPKKKEANFPVNKDNDDNIDNDEKTKLKKQITGVLADFSKATIIPMGRHEIKSPLELIKETPRKDKVLPIMAGMSAIDNIPEQIEYAREHRYSDVYPESWAERELQIISLYVLKKIKLDLHKIQHVYDVGCANSGQYRALFALINPDLDSDHLKIDYYAQDFNPDWEKRFSFGKKNFYRGPLPLIAKNKRDFDLVSCAHVLHYMEKNPIAIYTCFFSFNRLLKNEGYCYVIVPEKETQPGMLDLLEKSADDAMFSIIKSGKCRLVHDLIARPYNITTFLYIVLKKKSSVEEHEWKRLVGASLYKSQCFQLSAQYGIHSEDDIDGSENLLEKDLKEILYEKNSQLRNFRYIFEIINNEVAGNIPSKSECLKEIKNQIEKIHQILISSDRKNRKQLLTESCYWYLHWLIVFYINQYKETRSDQRINYIYPVVKESINKSTNVRVHIDNLNVEGVGRLTKHLFEFCQSENIELLDFFVKVIRKQNRPHVSIF